MTAVGNQPSRAVMRRLGMTLHAHFDHPSVPAGHPLRAHVAYRLPRPGAAAVQPERTGLWAGARTPGETAAATGRAVDRG